MNNTVYTFEIANLHAFWYLLFLLTGMPILFLLPSDISTGVVFLVILSGVVLSLVLVIKNYRVSERIQLQEDFLQSSRYGKIHYKEIVSASSPTWREKPCIKLSLSNGKTIFWGTWGGENAVIYRKKILANNKTIAQFIEVLSVKLRTDSNVVEKNTQEINTQTSGKPDVTQSTSSSSKRSSRARQLDRQMEEVKDKNRNQKWPAVVASLLFALVMLFKACSNL